MGGGGGSSQTFVAGNQFANVARELWDDNVARFYPVEKQLMGQLKGTTLPSALADATKSVNRSFEGQRMAMNSGLARYGQAPNAAQANEIDRQMKLAQTSALAGARDSARMAVKDRENTIMTGTGQRAPQLGMQAVM